ncbi:hypothetical protein ACW9HQ_48865 [Nocardia gipuzkoensis]
MRKVELFGAALLFTATIAAAPADAAAPVCGGQLSDWQNATYTGMLAGEAGELHSVTVRIPGDTVSVTSDTHSWEARDLQVQLRDGELSWGTAVPDRSFTQTLRMPLCAGDSTEVVAAEFAAESSTLIGSSTAFGWVMRT